MKTIRKIVGWFLVVFAGLWALSGLLCAVFTITGQLEDISGWPGRLGYTAGFLFLTAVSLWVVRLGWNLRAVKPAQKPMPPVRREPAPAQREKTNPVTTAPKAEAPAVKAAPASAVPEPKVVSPPAKKERTPLPTWVTGPGLCHDRFPYPGFGAWHERLDECRPGASCYVYNGDEPLMVAIRELAKKKGSKFRTAHVRLPSAKALEWLGDGHYAQKWELADAIPEIALDCDEELYAFCREHNIRIVTYEGPNVLYDHVNGCHLRICEEEGYGSVDDAATVGMWWVEEQTK